MYAALQVITVMLVAIAMALSLAHALELPGKLRLSREAYLTVQPIYYPGFTIGGFAEPFGALFLALLLGLTSPESDAFWPTAGALACLVLMHSAYWLLTHPVNNFWLKDVKAEGAGGKFFAFDPLGRRGAAGEPDWTVLRDRWERSHVLRAGLGLASLVLLATAVAL